MTLTLEDIVAIEIGDYIRYYDHETGWALAKVIDKGLNYVHIEALEGALKGGDWKESLQNMYKPNKYALYIPDTPEKISWWRRWFKKRLIRLLRRL